MWNWIMIAWMVICLLIAPLIVFKLKEKMTWREFLFFLFGVFFSGMPFIYLVNR